MFDLRTYSPERNVNDLGSAFDYAADVATLNVARSMLADAESAADDWGSWVAPSGEGMEPLMRGSAELALAKMNVLMLTGAVAQAQAAVASYPEHIVTKATERGFVS